MADSGTTNIPQLSPSQANLELRLNEITAAGSPALMYGVDPATTTGLVFGWIGGRWGGFAVPNGSAVLTASTTQYQVVAIATGAPSFSTGTTNWNDSTNYVRTYKITVGTSSLTYEDHRGGPGGINGGSAGGTGVGSVTSVALTPPAAGITGSVADATTTPVITLGLANDLAAVEGLAATGIVRRTATDTWSAGTAVSLTTEVSGVLPIANIATGTPTGTKFVRDDGTLAIPAGTGGDALTSNPMSQFAATTSAQLAGVMTNETGSGALVFATSPTLVTPVLGTPASGTLTNCTGLPVAGGGTGIAALTVYAPVFGGTTTTGAVQSGTVGTSGQVLTSNGAGALPTFQAAGGGASLSNWTEGVATASPNNTVPVVSLTVSNAASSVDAAIIPKALGALLGAIPDGTTTGGDKRGQRAVDWQLSRTTAAQVASGLAAVLAGGAENKASGNYSSGGGGFGNSLTNHYTSNPGGQGNIISGYGATVLGGTSNVGSGDYSTAGGTCATTRGIQGMQAFAPGKLNVVGDAQSGAYILYNQTTNATPKTLTANTGAATTTNSMVLPNNAAFSFIGQLVGRCNASGDASSWRLEGLIKRGANAASTALVSAVTPGLIAQDAGASAWAVTVTADTTNGGLNIAVTGVAATTINWVVVVRTAEIVG